MRFQHVLKALCSTPWMIQPEKLEAFAELLVMRIEGGRLTPEEIADRTAHPRKGANHEAVFYEIEASEPILAANGTNVAQTKTHIAVIPIYGIIDHRASMDISGGGGFDIQSFRAQFRNMLENPSVSAIVLDIDSPGGSVSGVDEISKEIYQARGQKKIVAVCNTLMASAAYYIGSSADEIAVSPSGEIGSIGVYMLHSDYSQLYADNGIKNTLIKAGKYKAEGNPWMALDEEAMASLQDQVDGHYDMFVKAVARNRGVNVDAVRNGFGQGRTVMAKNAVKLGMADKMATLEDVLKSLGSKSNKAGSNLSGEAETPEIEAVSVDDGLERALRQREIDMF